MNSHRSLLGASLCVLACLGMTGCEQLLGKALETALEQSDEALQPNAFYAKLKAEQESCPQAIYEHTVLQDVSLQGLDRVRYTYVVSESGRPEVNMLYQGTIRNDVLKRAQSSELGPLIAENELKVDHFFQDADGQCLIWIELTSQDYRGLEFANPAPADQPSVSLVNHTTSGVEPTEADRSELLKRIEDAQAQCPLKINDHTTLTSVSLKGSQRIKYHYVVTEDGLPEVNMDVEEIVKRQVIERARSTPLGDSIVALDMGVEHFFQSVDGKCMLWLQLTKKDFAEQEPPAIEADSAPPEANEPTTSEPARLDAYIPDASFRSFGSPIVPAGVQTNPYVK